MKTTEIKIAIVILFSFILSSFLINNIFLANSPKIKKDLARSLIAKFIFIKNNDKKIEREKFKINNNELLYSKIKENNFFSLNKGVYGQDLEKGSYILIKNQEVEWIEYTFKLKGEEIKIKVPKGEELPNQETIEKIFK